MVNLFTTIFLADHLHILELTVLLNSSSIFLELAEPAMTMMIAVLAFSNLALESLFYSI